MSTDLKPETVAMDDESDSCFAYKKPQMFHNKHQNKNHESDHCDLNNKSSKHLVTQHSPPMVKKKTISPQNLQIPNIKAVNTKPIDTIADNLKSKHLKQSSTEQSIPKVSLVKPISKPTITRTIYNDEALNKQYAHKLILYKLKQSELEDKNKTIDDDTHELDDLTNLNWLTTFNLSTFMNTSKYNILSLSPPKSPSSSPSSPNSISSISNKSLNSTRDYEDDEADSNSHQRTHRFNSNKLLTSILHQNELNRPNYTFSCLIFLAIETSERKRLSVKEIYSWISQTFSYYHNVPSGSWKNSIRHNLSLNRSFTKVDKNLLAMRDFSGKGSLWCIDPKVRVILTDLFQKCTLANNLDELNKNVHLKDINEMPLKQQPRLNDSIKKVNTVKCVNNQLRNAQPAIINPSLVRLANTAPKITNVSNKTLTKSNSFNTGANATTSVDSSCSELDAVKALLSMKSKAASMPTISTEEDEKCVNHDESLNLSKNRRKQLFKQPIKKSSKYEDEDEDVDVEEDYFIDEEDEDEDFDESFIENEKLINVTSSDEEDENGKLEIDEDFGHEAKKSNKDQSNLLLELSRAAVLVENDEPAKKKLKTSNDVNTAINRSMTQTTSVYSSKTMTRSKTKLNETK